MNNQLSIECSNQQVSSSDFNLTDTLSPKLTLVCFFNATNFENLHNKLSKHLSTRELERANKFMFANDNKTYTVCHAILRLILARLLKASSSLLDFEYEENGKPFINNKEIEFNLSHSKSHCVIAISPLQLGIDIEVPKKLVNFDDVVKKVFTQKEQDLIYTSSDPAKTFFTFWTRKEAVIKATGKGITSYLNEFSVCNGTNNAQPQHILLNNNRFKSENLFIQTFEYQNNTISLATQKESSIHFTEILEKDVIELLLPNEAIHTM